ncbi:MAG: hypothetical protein EP344_18790 [Bacteroidetes bacterium]|nr:MAG: hypothetical protein EP344_18790 [Bacteroidota bacterium]
MSPILIGSLLLSIFHALIPSHWLPVLAISRQEQWSIRQTLWITFLTGLAHVLSTVLAGGVLALAGYYLAERVAAFTYWFAPVLLITLGIFYIYQHYRHHHFHLHRQSTRWGIIGTLAIAMFMSPCLEIEGYFLAAGQYGWAFVLLLAVSYAVVTISGMLIWISLAFSGLKRLDWHAWEHNAGLITGITLALSGLLLFWME